MSLGRIGAPSDDAVGLRPGGRGRAAREAPPPAEGMARVTVETGSLTQSRELPLAEWQCEEDLKADAFDAFGRTLRRSEAFLRATQLYIG